MSLDKIEDSKFIDIGMFKDLSRQCINGLAGIHKAGIFIEIFILKIFYKQVQRNENPYTKLLILGLQRLKRHPKK